MSRKKLQIEAKILEKSKDGSLWEVALLPEGFSANGPFYPPEALRLSYKRAEGIPSYLYYAGEPIFEHLPGEFAHERPDGLVGNQIGWFRNARLATLDGKLTILADLYVHRAVPNVRTFLKDCWEHGKKIGFSITAEALAETRMHEGKEVDWILELWFTSADPVSYPAIGGAEALKLLESKMDTATIKEDRTMTENIKNQILSLATKLAPESVKDVGEDFNATKAVALLSNLMETFSPDSFPEESFKRQLSRLRDAIEDEDDETATNILGELLKTSEHQERYEALKKLEGLLTEEKLDKALEVVDQLVQIKESEQEGQKTGTPKTDEERLAAHFGDETATKLKELLGEDASMCLPERGQKVKAASLLWDKLEALKALIADEEQEAALNLLNAILEGEYSEPYPYPQPKSETGDTKVEEPGVETEEEESTTETSEKPEGEELNETPEEEEFSIEDELDAELVAEIKKLKDELEEEEADIVPDETEEVPGASETDTEPDEELEAEIKKLEDEPKEAKPIPEEEEANGLETDTQEGETTMETPESRLTRMELEQLLAESLLPNAAQEKLRAEFSNKDASPTELKAAIKRETSYLGSLNVPAPTPKDPLRKEREELKKQIKESKEAVQAEREELRNEIKELRESVQKERFSNLLESKLADVRLTKISENRVREAFSNKIGDEAALNETIASETKLATQIISEMASTVTDFGSADIDEGDFTEEKAVNIIHSFFSERMRVEEEQVGE